MKNKISIIATIIFSSALVFGASNAYSAMLGENTNKLDANIQVQTANQGEEMQVQVQNEEQVEVENSLKEELVCCKIFGIGSEMQEVNVKYDRIKKSECIIEEGFSGGGRDIVDIKMCSGDQLNKENMNSEGKSDEVGDKESNNNDTDDLNKEEVESNNSKEIEESDEDSTMKRAEERRSVVANAVQSILEVGERNQGIGEQIRVIAQNQIVYQEALEESLAEVENRSGFAEFFIGPKYNKINQSRKLIQQNKEQIEVMNQVMNQVQVKLLNEADIQTLEEQISILEETNLQIESSITKSENVFSLFGWLFK